MENNDVEHICRGYAIVPLKEEGYNPKVQLARTKIEKSYQDSLKVCDEAREKFVGCLSELEKMSLGEKGLLSSFIDKIKFRKESNDLEEIIKFGDFLSEKYKQIEEMREVADKAYNLHASVVYEISTNLRLVEAWTENSQREEKRIGEELLSLDATRNQEGGLRNYLSILVKKKKEKAKTSEEKINEEEIDKIVNTLINEGEDRLKELSKRYLEIKNDKSIVRGLAAYKPLAERYNDFADSFSAVRERINEQRDKVREVFLFYQTITKNEIQFLQEIELPQRFVQGVNQLAEIIGKVDKRFADSVLKSLLADDDLKINKPEFSMVTHELATHISEEERGKIIEGKAVAKDAELIDGDVD